MRSNAIRNRGVEFVLLCALALACILSVQAETSLVPLRGLLAFVLVFLAPGYALLRAVNPQRIGDRAEACLIVIGVSLVVSIFGGLLLNLTTWGLRPATEAIYLSTVSVVAGLVAVAHAWRASRPDEDWRVWRERITTMGLTLRAAVFEPSRRNRLVPDLKRLAAYRAHVASQWRRMGDGQTLRALWRGVATHRPEKATLRRWSPIVLALVITVGSVGAAIANAQAQQTAQSATAFWALPPSASSKPDTIILGITNSAHATGTTKFDVAVTYDNTLKWHLAVDLRPDGTWQSSVTIPGWSSGQSPVQIDLYDANNPQVVIRHLTLWPAQPTPTVTPISTNTSRASTTSPNARAPRPAIVP